MLKIMQWNNLLCSIRFQSVSDLLTNPLVLPLLCVCFCVLQIILELNCSHWAAALGAFLVTFGKHFFVKDTGTQSQDLLNEFPLKYFICLCVLQKLTRQTMKGNLMEVACVYGLSREMWQGIVQKVPYCAYSNILYVGPLSHFPSYTWEQIPLLVQSHTVKLKQPNLVKGNLVLCTGASHRVLQLMALSVFKLVVHLFFV